MDDLYAHVSAGARLIACSDRSLSDPFTFEKFKIWRRAGIAFPQYSVDNRWGAPVEVALVAKGQKAYPDSNEVDAVGWIDIVSDPMLVIELNEDVEKTIAFIKRMREERKQILTLARFVEKGTFTKKQVTPIVLEVSDRESELKGMNLQELRELAQSLGVIEASKMRKGELITAIMEKEKEKEE